MCDIDRAVEVATNQMLNALTERPCPEPEPVPYWPMGWAFATVAEMNKRDAIIAERDAVLAELPRFAGERAEVVNG